MPRFQKKVTANFAARIERCNIFKIKPTRVGGWVGGWTGGVGLNENPKKRIYTYPNRAQFRGLVVGVDHGKYESYRGPTN